MKRQLKGRKVKIGKDKWKLIVNLGYNLTEKRYDRRTRVFYGNDRESDAALREFIYELENPQLIASEMLLCEWLDYWLESYGKPIYNWEQNTYERNGRIVRVNIKPYIGHIPLNALEPSHVLEHYAYLRISGKKIKKRTSEGTVSERGPLAARTVKYVHTILNQALSEAVKLRKILDNPCKGLSPASEKGKPYTKWVVLNATQLKEFIQNIHNHRDYALIHIASYSGARQSELLGLEKDAILWDKSSIRIKQALHVDDESEDGFELRPRTKNETSTRTVKLSKRTMDVLAEYIKKQEAAGINNALVFTEPDGQPIKRDNLYHRFVNLAKKNGHPGMAFHHLRHTHATILLSNGAYINEVSKRLGHANPKITLSVYGHCLPEGEEILVTQFDSLLT